ncbi:unknown protein [Seminavis robusta]|uniref:Uncharacterized protein n=1 Tax=Seminavis robusta TaxID=568900 RepID=A0A9N8F283_9STRA|nr:unknown protein [Seminavis robusta]|eukprot:Sro2956_g340970.1 n/a (349) ;mRNA; f:3214-4260
MFVSSNQLIRPRVIASRVAEVNSKQQKATKKVTPLLIGAFHLSTSGIFHPDTKLLSVIGSFPAVLLCSSIILFKSEDFSGVPVGYLTRLLLFFFQFEILNNLKTVWAGATLDARSKDNAIMELFPRKRTITAMWAACLLSVSTMVLASIASGGSLFNGALIGLITVHHYMEFDNKELNQTLMMSGKSHWVIKNLVAAFVGYWLLPCWMASVDPLFSSLGQSMLQRSAFAVFYWQNQDIKDIQVDREEGCTTLSTMLEDKLGYKNGLLVNALLTVTSGLGLMVYLTPGAVTMSSASVWVLCAISFVASGACQVHMAQTTSIISEKKAQRAAKLAYGFMVLCEVFTLFLL